MSKHCAIVLSAGKGKRMGTSTPKQYLELCGKPILFYSLKAMEDSFIDDIILVVGKGEAQSVKNDIVDKYGFKKIRKIVEGGKERYHSVYNGIQAAEAFDPDYIYIHDGARPFITEEILERAKDGAKAYRACVVGMPSKDTVKLADEEGFAATTPNRNLVWTIQTPQTFEYKLISDAYSELIIREEELIEKGITITDDAMVIEQFSGVKVKLVEGAYTNIKITTVEDLLYAKMVIDSLES